MRRGPPAGRARACSRRWRRRASPRCARQHAAAARGSALAAALARRGARPTVAAVARTLLDRARRRRPGDPVAAVIGLPGERKPLIVDGDWLYAERMHALEERFCARIRERAARSRAAAARRPRADPRAWRPSPAGPPPLTDEQQARRAATRSRRRSRSSPGARDGEDRDGRGAAPGDRVDRACRWSSSRSPRPPGRPPSGWPTRSPRASRGRAISPTRGSARSRRAPQTLHRLLGWSPSRGRFARHENDPLPYRFVVVDEASMIDLADDGSPAPRAARRRAARAPRRRRPAAVDRGGRRVPRSLRGPRRRAARR